MEPLTGVTTTAGGAVMVKVASQVAVPQPVVEVEVKVTVFEPPHLSGAPVLLFERVPLVALAVPSHDAYAAFTAAWSA